MSASPVLKKDREFEFRAFLTSLGEGTKVMLFPKKQTIFAQGVPADAVFYLETGKVRLAVVSKTGKEATIGILSEGSFFGEGALAGQTVRMGTAIALTDCSTLRVEKKVMMQALHREHSLSDMSWPTCYRATFVTKKTWLISCLIPARRGWPEYF
jgi:CRP/FNR family cyclic AMP-dependent transcriptional regulator